MAKVFGFLCSLAVLALIINFTSFVWEGDKIGYEDDVRREVETALRQKLQPKFGVNEADLTTMHCDHIANGVWQVEGYIKWPILTKHPETDEYLRNRGKYIVTIKYGGKIEYDWGNADNYIISNCEIIYDIGEK